MKNLCLAFVVCTILTSCIEIEEKTLVLKQKKQTATLYLHNITSSEKGEERIKDFEGFMDSFETGEVLNEFFLDDADLGESILKKKIYQRKGQLHAKIEFQYDSLEQLGFNSCFYEDSIAQTVKVDEIMQDRIYFHVPPETIDRYAYHTNGLILNSFAHVFETKADVEDFPIEDIISQSLVFAWEKDAPINYTYYTPIDSSNTSMLNYWKANK